MSKTSFKLTAMKITGGQHYRENNKSGAIDE